MRWPAVIFSDLDGTLLDPVSYSFAPAIPALDRLRSQGMALVLCSSKTRAEMAVYRQRLDNPHPFVVENGGGICMTHGYFAADSGGEQNWAGDDLLALGTPHADIRREFVALRAQLGVRVRGFTDMSVLEVAQLTGLDEAQAALAKERDFDEPFVFDDAPDVRFLQAIREVGLSWTEGRIFHIMGHHDKGLAVRHLRALYEQAQGATPTMGLGDALNDLPMLQAVDYPVLVRHEDGPSDARINVPGLVTTHGAGPQGWNEAVLQFLADLRAGLGRTHARVAPVAP